MFVYLLDWKCYDIQCCSSAIFYFGGIGILCVRLVYRRKKVFMSKDYSVTLRLEKL